MWYGGGCRVLTRVLRRFFIHGDALVAHIASDPFLALGADGVQLLHAIDRLESFLNQLVRRKCQFHVVFFNGTVDLGALADWTSRFGARVLQCER